MSGVVGRRRVAASVPRRTYRPVPAGRDRGYAPEKWHWSYAPVSDAVLREYLRTVRNEDVTGFAGASAAPVLDIVGQWVDIRPDSLR